MARSTKTPRPVQTRNLLARRSPRCAIFEPLEERCLFSTYTVTTTNDSGPGSLRQAILNANAANVAATINFIIPGSGIRTIEPLSALPSLTASHVTIVGPKVAVPNSRGTVMVPEIELLGSKLKTGDGLSIHGTHDVVSTLQIAGFPVDGIYLAPGSNEDSIESNVLSRNSAGLLLYDASSASITGNLIGTNPEGTVSQSNTEFGISLQAGASHDTIGGASVSDRNIISTASFSTGPDDEIDISGPTTINNVIEGNYLGITSAGSAALGAAKAGVKVFGPMGPNSIGMPGHGNVISGSSTDVELDDCSGVAVQSNLIGTDATGKLSIPTKDAGIDVRLGAHNNTIGGKTSADRNVIAASTYGVFLEADTSHNTVAGNYVGTNIGGTAVIAHASNSDIEVDGSSNQIGLPADGNVVDGSPSYQISVIGNDNTVQGNFIGTNAAGNMGLQSPSADGVGIQLSGKNNLIGTTAVGGVRTGAANLISGNAEGIDEQGPVNGTGNAVGPNTIAGNRIGTDVTGHHAIGNLFGIDLYNAVICKIGLPNDGNVISGSIGLGALVYPGAGINIRDSDGGVTVQGNLIGTDITGTTAIPNVDGINLDESMNVLIGSTAPNAMRSGAANVISGNSSDGINTYIYDFGNGASNNTIAGNLIGVNAAGTQILANHRAGIELTYGPISDVGSNVNSIGLPGDGNVISGNPIGILIDGSNQNFIAGNLIGLDITGENPLGNGIGIQLENGAADNDIGVAGTGGENYIAASTKYGLLATGAGTKNNPVSHTTFGKNLSGHSLPNVLGNTRYQNGATP